MTVRLTLVRHGHAEPDANDGDFARKLDARGRSEAALCAEHLRALHYRPSLILASPAQRTTSTAEALQVGLSLNKGSLRLEPRLYLADQRTLRTIVAETDSDVHHLLIVGHNPGLSDFAAELSDARAHAFATGAFCSLTFDTTDWREVEALAPSNLHQEAPSARAM